MLERLALVFGVLAAVLLASCNETRQPELEVVASTTTLVGRETAQLTVTRQFAGGPVEDMTGRVAFSVRPSETLDVDRFGVVRALMPGNAYVHVRDLDSEATAKVSFTVLPSTIASLRLDPSPTAALAPGQTRLFKAIATYTDGTEQDRTSQLHWTSSNERAAAVGTTQGSFGVVTALAVGETTITALDAETRTEARSVVIVSGAAPALVAIRVTPNPATVAVGAPVPFVATGVYANGTTADITRNVGWSSSDAANATVDANGVAVGVAVGDVTITAADAASGVRGSTALNVQ